MNLATDFEINYRNLRDLMAAIDATFGTPADVAAAFKAAETLAAHRAEQVTHLATARAAALADVLAAAEAGKPLPKMSAKLADASRAEDGERLQAEITAEAVHELKRRALAAVRRTADQLIRDHLAPRVVTELTALDGIDMLIRPGFDDAAAFDAPENVQAAWRQARDCAAVVSQALDVRQSLRAWNFAARPRRDPADVFGLYADPQLVDDSRFVTTGGQFSNLPREFVHKLLELSRRGASWQFPTAAEQDAAAAAWLDKPAAERTRIVDTESRVPGHRADTPAVQPARADKSRRLLNVGL